MTQGYEIRADCRNDPPPPNEQEEPERGSRRKGGLSFPTFGARSESRTKGPGIFLAQTADGARENDSRPPLYPTPPLSLPTKTPRRVGSRPLAPACGSAAVPGSAVPAGAGPAVRPATPAGRR